MTSCREDISVNLRSFYRAISAGDAFRHEHRGGVEVFWNRKGHWPALLVGMPDQSAVKDLVKEMAAGELPQVIVLDGEDPGILDRLESEGLRQFRTWRGMYLDPAEFHSSSCPAELVLRNDCPEDLDDLRRVVNEILLEANPMGKEITAAMETSPDLHWVVGRVEGQALAVGILCLSEGIGGIYMVSTSVASRGKGYGSALISTMVDIALLRGAGSVILHSSAMGEGIYSRIGFRYVEDYTLMISL